MAVGAYPFTGELHHTPTARTVDPGLPHVVLLWLHLCPNHNNTLAGAVTVLDSDGV